MMVWVTEKRKLDWVKGIKKETHIEIFSQKEDRYWAVCEVDSVFICHNYVYFNFSILVKISIWGKNSSLSLLQIYQ